VPLLPHAAALAAEAVLIEQRLLRRVELGVERGQGLQAGFQLGLLSWSSPAPGQALRASAC
jgi:hypothetical protein